MRIERLYMHMYGKLGDGASPLTPAIDNGYWLLHLLSTANWVTARLCATLVSGPSLSPCERRSADLLSTPLFSAGLDSEELLGESDAAMDVRSSGSGSGVGPAATSRLSMLKRLGTAHQLLYALCVKRTLIRCHQWYYFCECGTGK